MAYLSFIDDQTLENIVDHVLQKGHKARIKSHEKIDHNVIDPFSVLLEMSSFAMTFDGWLDNEKNRQAQKTLSNQIGFFHQNILGSLKGWRTLGIGGMVDVVCDERKIIAEIKNKHNTLKASDRSGMYFKLEDLVMRKGHAYKDYTAYYVEIVPKKPARYDEPFTPSDNRTGARCQANPLIRKIDGYSFYALATGIEDALYDLFSVLSHVIAKVKPDYTILETGSIEDFFRKTYL